MTGHYTVDAVISVVIAITLGLAVRKLLPAPKGEERRET